MWGCVQQIMRIGISVMACRTSSSRWRGCSWSLRGMGIEPRAVSRRERRVEQDIVKEFADT